MNAFQVSNDGIDWYFWESATSHHLLYSWPFVREVKVEIVNIVKENDKFKTE